jgi:hypothetical protein
LGLGFGLGFDLGTATVGTGTEVWAGRITVGNGVGL